MSDESKIDLAIKRMNLLAEKAAAFDWLEENSTNISIQYYIGGKSIGVSPDKGIMLLIDGELIYYGENLLDCVNQTMKQED